MLHQNACINWCCFFFFSHLLPLHLSWFFFFGGGGDLPPFTSRVWTCCSLTFMFPISYDHRGVVILVSLFLISLQCDFLYMACVNGWFNSPNEIPSLDAPPGESPSPSPTQPLEPQTQIKKETQEKMDKEEGDQTASIHCNEIHAAGLRRSSEPLPYNLPQPHAEPPMETVTHLIVTSEQRSLSWYMFFSKPQIS